MAQADVRGAAVSWRVVVALKSTDHAGGRAAEAAAAAGWLRALEHNQHNQASYEVHTKGLASTVPTAVVLYM
jgi:hypothetical protein